MNTRLQQVYRSADGTSTWLPDVLPRKLRIDRNWRALYFKQPRQVLFEGIRRVPFEEVVPEGLLQLAAAPRSGGNSPPESFKQLTDTLLQIIDEQWWPEGMHVVLHSSGYDSRLISWALTKLRGQRDLGQLLFLCTREEGSAFRQVMKYERWEPNQYLILDEALEPSRYFTSELTNFKDFWT